MLILTYCFAFGEEKMLLNNFIQKLFFRLFTLIVSALFASGGIVSPAKDSPIIPESSSEMVFVAFGDPQVSNYMFKRYPAFSASCEDFRNNKGSFDAVLMAGDIAENGLAEEYQLVYDGISGLGCRYIVSQGNHDIRLRSFRQSTERFVSFVNALNGDEKMEKFNYSETVNGYKFIVLGAEKTAFEENAISDEQLEWLDEEIAAENGKPVFIVVHQPLKLTHGLPDTWNSPIDLAGSIGDVSEKLEAVLNNHENVVLITGHLHTGFGRYSYEKIGNFHSVNLPSLCCNNDFGEYNEQGIGYVVEVSSEKAVFRARNFMQGKWLPDYDFAIDFEVKG